MLVVTAPTCGAARGDGHEETGLACQSALCADEGARGAQSSMRRVLRRYAQRPIAYDILYSCTA